MTQQTHGSEGWRPDPFGRFESRFHDGTKWTPYVKNGEKHDMDDPVEGVVRNSLAGPDILEEKILVIEQHVDENNRFDAYNVHGASGRVLGSVRRSMGDSQRLEAIDDAGAAFLNLQIVSSGRKRIVSVRNSQGAELGRLVQQHLPGINWYEIEGADGKKVGYVRARTWVGWDVRIEDDQSRLVATATKSFDGLDRSLFPAPDNYVVRILKERPEPLHTLLVAAALGLDTVLKQDTRGFN